MSKMTEFTFFGEQFISEHYFKEDNITMQMIKY